MILLLDCTVAVSAKKSSGDTDSGDGAIPDAVAGPIVRAVVDRLKVANTTDAMEKKKTIAQMIDEALEQEFPEEKQEKIGKNYNETAKNSDVSGHNIHNACVALVPLQMAPGHDLLMQATVETVLKVSQKQPQEDEDDDDTAVQDAASNSTSSPILPSDNAASRKAEGNSSVKALAPSGSRPPKAKSKKVESHAEKEVDRIIDSQDNEYVLSKPK